MMPDCKEGMIQPWGLWRGLAVVRGRSTTALKAMAVEEACREGARRKGAGGFSVERSEIPKPESAWPR